MKGLLQKDIYVITKQLKIFLLIAILFAFVGNSQLASISILLVAVLPMTAIAYDERSKWNELAVMMPYSKFELIFSKYLLGYVGIIGAAFLTVLGQGIGSLLGLIEVDGIGIKVAVSLLLGLCFIGINTPILFKFGSEKGRFVFLFAMALVGASGPLLAQLDPGIISAISQMSLWVFFVGAVALNGLSVLLSMKIGLAKE